MKKLLALLMVVIMTAGIIAIPAFAAGEYLYDEDKTESDLRVNATGSWLANYNTSAAADLVATEATTNASSNYNIGNQYKAMVYKVPLPTVPNGKVIDYAEFRMSSYFMAKYVPYLYGIPSSVNMDTLTVGEMRNYVNYNTLGSGTYFIGNVMKDAAYQGDTTSNSGVARNRFDVSNYIANAIANGDNYVYLAAAATSTTIKAYRYDAGSAGAKLYYTLKDAPAFASTGTSIEEGATSVNPIDNVTFAFSNAVASATATINGVDVASEDIEVNGINVKVAYELGLNTVATIVVNATDAYGATISHTLNFTTGSKYRFYNDSDMEGIPYVAGGEGTWLVNYNPATVDTSVLAAEKKTSTTNFNVGNAKNAVVFKMKLPEVPDGKIIGMAEFRAMAWFTSLKFIDFLYAMPGEAWNMDTMTVADAQKIFNGKNLGTGDYYLTRCTSDASYFDDVSLLRCKYSVTDYVNECIENGQEYIWFGATYDYTIKVYPHHAGSYYGTRLFYTLEDVPALIAESSVPENGATDVYPFGNASITFSNVIKSATATINGAEVPESDISISGKNVTIAYDVPLSQEAQLVVNVKDGAKQELIHTVNFAVADRYKYYDDSDMKGVDYVLADDSWHLTYDGAATNTDDLAAADIVYNTSNDVVGYSKTAAVYRVKLPKLPEGKTIATAEFRVTSHYTATDPRGIEYAYKMPGDDWNMSTLTIGEAQKIIDTNNIGADKNYISSSTSMTDNSYVNGKERRNKYSVTEYVAEAIANGQEYLYIAVARKGGMVRAYSHNTSGREAKLFFMLCDAPVIKGAKLVSADSDASYADAADIAPAVGRNIKAICYLMNKTDADVALNVGVAQYSDGELVSLSFVPYTLFAGTDGSTVDFGASTIQKGVDEIKILMWDAYNNPVVVSKTIDVK